MKILVDADACPVKDIIVKVAKEYNLSVVMFIDTSHELRNYSCEIVGVDKGKDSVDLALINRTDSNDIVVTQDYGVATMALGKGAFALSQNGLVFTSANIDGLLFERHISAKNRRAGNRGGYIPKRTKEDDIHFETQLRKLIDAINNLI